MLHLVKSQLMAAQHVQKSLPTSTSTSFRMRTPTFGQLPLNKVLVAATFGQVMFTSSILGGMGGSGA